MPNDQTLVETRPGYRFYGHFVDEAGNVLADQHPDPPWLYAMYLEGHTNPLHVIHKQGDSDWLDNAFADFVATGAYLNADIPRDLREQLEVVEHERATGVGWRERTYRFVHSPSHWQRSGYCILTSDKQDVVDPYYGSSTRTAS